MESPTADPGLDAWETCQRMLHRLGARISREVASASGLSDADFAILGALVRADGPIRPVALGCGLDWEKSRLSHHLRRMADRGLISRDSCLDDRRGQEISLTDAGRIAHAKAKSAYDETVHRYATMALSQRQRRELRDIAEVVLARLEE